MFSTPFTSFSIGVVTVCSTTWAFAPGKFVLTETVGGVMSGIDSIGRVGIEIVPRITITMAMTSANTGR